MADLTECMKQAALQAMRNAKPTAVMFGQVINSDPLEILVEQRLTLNQDQLILTRNVTDFQVDVELEWGTSYSLGKHSHSCPEGSTNSVNLSHNHTVYGGNMTVRNGLQDGEIVLLIRQEGGQKFVVVDRVVNDNGVDS